MKIKYFLLLILLLTNQNVIAGSKFTLTIDDEASASDCKKMAKMVKNTPDFFEQFYKRGYEYIYKDSPFKLKLTPAKKEQFIEAVKKANLVNLEKEVNFYITKNESCSKECYIYKNEDEVIEITKTYYKNMNQEFDFINQKNVSLYKGEVNFFNNSKDPSYFIIAFGKNDKKEYDYLGYLTHKDNSVLIDRSGSAKYVNFPINISGKTYSMKVVTHLSEKNIYNGIVYLYKYQDIDKDYLSNLVCKLEN